MTERSERTVRTIYLLCNENSDFGRDVYVGSTSLPLAQRLACHKCDSARNGNVGNKLYTRMREVGLESWVIRPLLSLECSRDEIRVFERTWLNILRSDLNSNDPIQTEAERRGKKSSVLRGALCEK